MPGRLSEQPSVTVFSIYSKEDLPLLKELEAHLALLSKTNQIIFWNQEDVELGSEWEPQVWKKFEEANIILFLISSDFFSSLNCEKQATRAFTRYNSDKVDIINIYIRPCYWAGTQVAVFPTLPSGLDPITSWANRDEAWSRVIKELHQFIERRLRGQAKITGAEKDPNLDPYATSNFKPKGIWAWIWQYITRQ